MNDETARAAGFATQAQQLRLGALFEAFREEIVKDAGAGYTSDVSSAFERTATWDGYSIKQDAYAVWFNDHIGGGALFYKFNGDSESFGRLSQAALEVASRATGRVAAAAPLCDSCSTEPTRLVRGELDPNRICERCYKQFRIDTEAEIQAQQTKIHEARSRMGLALTAFDRATDVSMRREALGRMDEAASDAGEANEEIRNLYDALAQ